MGRGFDHFSSDHFNSFIKYFSSSPGLTFFDKIILNHFFLTCNKNKSLFLLFLLKHKQINCLKQQIVYNLLSAVLIFVSNLLTLELNVLVGNKPLTSGIFNFKLPTLVS